MKNRFNLTLQRSNAPTLQRSNAPTLQRSNAPTGISLLMAVFLAALLFPNNINAQPCPYPGGATLCQQFGAAHIQVNIQNPTSSNTWLNTFFNGQTIFINATFTVNSPFSFINCTTRFGPNGRILVVAGGNFQSTDSRYFSCDVNGWPGIRAEGGNTLFVNNQIEDAQNAITIASSAASLTITRNTFNRNRVDILVPGHIVANAIFAGNTFDATSPNFLNLRPEAGISAISSFVTVGLPQPTAILDRNVFRNHQIGASGLSARMNFRFATFECSDFGTFSDRGSVDIRGQGIYRNLFSYNNTDVLTSQANLLCYDSDFEHCIGNNVNSLNNLNAQIIDFRSFNIFRIDTKVGDAINKTGINLDRSRGGAVGAFTNRIETNAFVIDQFLPQQSRRAIKVGGGPGSPDIMKIWGNAVTVGPGGSNEAMPNPSSLIDVHVGFADNFSVWFNNIFTNNADLENHRNRWGFYLYGRVTPSSGHTLIENHVTGTGYDHGMCAYHFVDSGPWLMCKNTADFTLRGFHVTGKCETSRFSYNTMGHHARSSVPGATNQTGALQMEPGSRLGPQFCRHNIWGVADYAPDKGAWHKGGGTVADSRFDYNPNLAGEEPTPITPVAGWFFDECTEVPPPLVHCGYEIPPPPALDGFETKIIQDNQVYNPPSTVIAWEEQKQTMAKLLRYPNLKTGNTLATNFYNIYYNSSAGKFAQFNEMLNNSALIDSIQLANLTSIRNQIAFFVGKVDSLDGTIPNATAAQNLSSGFFYYRSTLLSPIGQLMYLEESTDAQISATRLTSLGQCSQYLLTLPQSTTYEWNQAFLNGLEIKKSQGLTLSQSDLTTLRIIANQCPELVGNTREQAINLLPVGDAAIFRPDVPNIPGCPGLYEEGEERTSISNRKLDVLISPNPVTEILNVIFDKPFSGTIDVFDMAGKSVLPCRQVKMQNNLELSVDGLLPGIYLLSARTDFGERITLKFAVSK